MLIFMVLKSGKGRRRTGRRRKGTREECREGREEGIGVRGLENGSGVGRGGRPVGWGGRCGEARASGVGVPRWRRRTPTRHHGRRARGQQVRRGGLVGAVLERGRPLQGLGDTEILAVL